MNTNEILDWDIVSWEKSLKFWELVLPIDLNGKKVLELGAHKGGLSAWLAKKGADVITSDIEPLPPEAQNLFNKYDLAKKIEFQKIDATNIPYENHFDIIIFKSIVGGIGRDNKSERQKKLFQQIHKALKPGGQLLFAENLKSSPIHRWARKKFIRWGDSWNYINTSDIKTYLKEFKSSEIHSNGFGAAFGRSETQRRFLGLLDNFVINSIVPSDWHYIVYGMAVK